MVSFLPEPRVVPVEAKRQYALGLDLGQSGDPTAISVIERIVGGTGEWVLDARETRREKAFTTYHLRHLQRLELGTSYVQVVSVIAAMIQRPPLTGNVDVIADATGVGKPVMDLFAATGLRIEEVIITAGYNVTRSSGVWHVAKLRLISNLEAQLHSGALRIAAGLAEGPALAGELQDFRRHTTAAGHAVFGARVGRHDDLVLSTALACWWAVEELAWRDQPSTIPVRGW